MRALGHLVLTGFRLFVREPAAFFFTLVFPLLVLVLFGFIFGNEPDPAWGGVFGYIDYAVPALAAIIIGNIALMAIPVATATARENGILRRYRSTPVRPLMLFAADLTVYLAMAVAGMTILVVAATLFFELRFTGSWPVVTVSFLLAALAFSSVGYLIASLAPTARVAQTVGMVAFFPMMFLSGAAMPRQIMPEKVVAVSDLLPADPRRDPAPGGLVRRADARPTGRAPVADRPAGHRRPVVGTLVPLELSGRSGRGPGGLAAWSRSRGCGYPSRFRGDAP